MELKISRIATIGAAAIGGGLLTGAATAHAFNGHGVETLYKGHMLWGHGLEYESGPYEYWFAVENGSTDLTINPLSPNVCNYQGAFGLYGPGGTLNGVNFSSTHSGCSYGGWFSFSQLQGYYLEDSRFTPKWKSQHTSFQWIISGTIQD